MWPNPNQILWRSWACIKMQTLETFSVITVHVRIFSGLVRNDLMYSLRICEIFLFKNAKVLFLDICLLSAILYVTRHLVIYEGFCLIFGRSRHEKKKKYIKKNATQNLTRCPHGPSNNFYIAIFAVYVELSESYVEHRVQFLQRLVSRILVRSVLRINALNCFKGEIFLASVGRLFHSFGPVYRRECFPKVTEVKRGRRKPAFLKS